MNIFLSIYNEILWRPLFNLLIWIYTALPWQDIGVAVILVTLITRLILTPLLIKAQKAQKDLASLQPEIKKIQERNKNNKEAQSRELMEIYKIHNVNPFSSCLVVLIQLPVLIALFHVFQKSLTEDSLAHLYSFLSHPGAINTISFGILDLSQPNLYLGAIAAITQFYQTKLTGTVSPLSSDKKNDFSHMLQWQMTYLIPILILVWSYTFPSVLVLYWTALNLFGIVQEFLTRKKKEKREAGQVHN